MKKTKVFGIGFHKTATTSLGAALEILGYKVKGPFGIHDPNIKDKALNCARLLVKKYDAFQDNPWPIIYKEMDNMFPGSKFILTTRPSEKWIKSVVNHFRGKSTPMREWIYGVGDPIGNEGIYLKRYDRHNKEVLKYFSQRENDLLVMDITSGDGWKMLCPFLNEEEPNKSFPMANKNSPITQIKRIGIAGLKKITNKKYYISNYKRR
jgi:hypothetical protein